MTLTSQRVVKVSMDSDSGNCLSQSLLIGSKFSSCPTRGTDSRCRDHFHRTKDLSQRLRRCNPLFIDPLLSAHTQASDTTGRERTISS